ncbi:uncharacterized protein A1O5_07590 [Cladophialophora psammophila CBS 110553]|uniref:Uncharacterized protein n=1 Tax=Cladophialophora psammophila CBS 110553 TaxID=1182543 RepID=W9XGR2_9EURO|nr:uncharacterized protein A1O5_07590 [Cladophialophora psammophila CBS 110553]EXJ69554.1 hypothetical protein A1O5_07590 [Cladophialophora psammophila CBS 110553]
MGRNILWTSSPSDLRWTTHIIIADPLSRSSAACDDTAARMGHLLRAVDVVRSAVNDRSDATIIMASAVPEVGTTRRLLQRFHASGHRVGIAPQLREAPAHGLEHTLVNPLPMFIAGIDKASQESVLSLYRSVFGEGNVLLAPDIECVEMLKGHEMLMQAWDMCTTSSEIANACKPLQLLPA